MLEKPILSGRIRKWAYALIEYDLTYESLHAMRGQVIANFIVDHRIKDDENINYVSVCPWKLYFDGSVCRDGQGVGNVLISPNNMVYETSVRLEYPCTNNQTKYEALLFGLQTLVDMGVKDIDAYGDSLLVVQQIKGEFQCFDGVLNSYLDRCLDIIKSLDTFTIHHIPREENSRANYLAQQASGYQISRGKFFILERSLFSVLGRDSSLLDISLVHDANFFFERNNTLLINSQRYKRFAGCNPEQNEKYK
jgi:ribonuclease HI